MWTALPSDYYLRVNSVGHLRIGEASKFPAPTPDQPLAPALLLRTLRLNCQNKTYARLREELSRAAVREHILLERAEPYLLVNDPGDPVVQAARRSLEAAIKHPSPLSDAIKEVLEAALRETAEDEELEIPDPKSIERSRLARRAAVDLYRPLLEGRDRKEG